MNIIGTFMGTPSAKKKGGSSKSSDMPPADLIMEMLREQPVVDVKELLGSGVGNVQDMLDAISSLERYGMIVHERNDDGTDILRLPDQ